MFEALPFSALVLAGGQSSRMGRDKALLPMTGQTLLERISRQAGLLFEETIVVVNDCSKVDCLDLGNAKVFKDIFAHRGPMAGIYTGLVQSQKNACCVLTCDMPFVDANLLQRLCDGWTRGCDAACFQESLGTYLPFPGVYSRSARFLIRRLLENHENAMHHFLDTARVKAVPLGQVNREALFNMNTPEDYQGALKHERRGRLSWIPS